MLTVPQSCGRILAVIAGRALMSHTAAVTAGVVVAGSVVFAVRDGHSNMDLSVMPSVETRMTPAYSMIPATTFTESQERSIPDAGAQGEWSAPDPAFELGPRFPAHGVAPLPVAEAPDLELDRRWMAVFASQLAELVRHGGAQLWTMATHPVASNPAVDSELASETEPPAPKSVFAADNRQRTLVTGEVVTNLYSAASEAGLDAAEIHRVLDLFRYAVDYERDLRRGDRFEILFERAAKGAPRDIVYATLINKGSRIVLYRGEDETGAIGYFDASGRSNRRSIMRTPVAGARVSSHFGMRRHPILGYNKMHRGVDFAAPHGTPILAAGGGIVEYAGRRGSYGNYIRIRHTGKHQTAYAHLSRFARGLNAGDRVRQGQVIGYVGSTGRSTGPHLHFEVLRDGDRVNPMRIAEFGPGKILSGPALSRFKVAIARVEVALGSMGDGPRLALAQDRPEG